MTKIKNTLEGINSRVSEAEEHISELEGKMVEITSEDQNKVKRMKRTGDSLRDLWDNIKHTNIQFIQVPKEEERKKNMRRFLKRLQLKISPNVEQEIVNQAQEAQRVPYRVNPGRNMARHMLIKLTKTKHKDRN